METAIEYISDSKSELDFKNIHRSWEKIASLDLIS